MSKRALIFVNRNARSGKKRLAQAVDILDELEFELVLVPSKRSGELVDLIRKHQDDLDLVIIGGGDGTLNRVVDVLVETQLPLGILPLGTANDLARTLGLPQSVPDACRAIAQGKRRSIDLGWVNGKYFFNVASLGLSVKITRRLSQGMKQRWGILAYAISAVQALTQLHPFRAEIRVDGETIAVKTLQIAVGNGRYYGGGMAIAEDAAIDDQRLDLYSLEVKHLWQFIPLLWKMRRGQQASLPWVRGLHGQEIEIHTREPHAINTDGEITTATPATFRVIPQALTVLVAD
ncbi:lipid kinase [Thermoleptolyngbya sp. C42_A2020_037]|uniref:lipid kinase n=1 Tax=Thermoleptolyngbya sp. C42_A2020_037 TaxID=2747799 RepID=UPI0019DED4E7|nr:lipid kinase [Thermoleptolyngbya sp. C42_A2020_037]MBF2083178.1 lipid kinase [Thermoleptolyngbya sp. C42_A2020_037]